MTDAITQLLLDAKTAIQRENADFMQRIEANKKLLDQLEVRLTMPTVLDAESPRTISATPHSDGATKKKLAGAAIAFSSDSHASKLMKVIYTKRRGVTSDQLQAESGIDSATVKNIKKVVWNTTWRLCNDGYAERIGNQKEKVIPTDKGIKAWEASPLYRAA